MLNITVVQPSYFAGDKPDEIIEGFLYDELEKATSGGLIVLPEYSNAGGLSDKESELKAVPRADVMLKKASAVAKEKECYVAINVLHERDGKLKNSTYLFDKNGDVAYIYNKIHLPPSEIALGVEAGNGSCVCELDGIKFGFMTCYDVYYNEQIEYIAQHKPDIIIIPVYQRGERADIIRAQTKLIAFRCNAFVARSSYSMDSDERGGCSMIVASDGQIIKDMGKTAGSTSAEIDPYKKLTRPAGFGCGIVRNDDFIAMGLCPEKFTKE